MQPERAASSDWLITVDTYDLDDDLARPGPEAPVEHRSRFARRWPAFVVLLMVIAVALFATDQRNRDHELDALLSRVERGQSAVRYTDAQIQAMVQYTSPHLLSARAPSRVRASLRAVVQKTAADRLEPMQGRRDAVAEVSISGWHRDLRRAQAAYLAYLDERIAVLRAVATNLRALYQPQPAVQRLLAEARAALLTASSDTAATKRITDYLPKH